MTTVLVHRSVILAMCPAQLHFSNAIRSMLYVLLSFCFRMLLLMLEFQLHIYYLLGKHWDPLYNVISNLITVLPSMFVVTFVFDRFIFRSTLLDSSFNCPNIVCTSSRSAALRTMSSAKRRWLKNFPFMFILIFSSNLVSWKHRVDVNYFGVVLSYSSSNVELTCVLMKYYTCPFIFIDISDRSWRMNIDECSTMKTDRHYPSHLWRHI